MRRHKLLLAAGLLAYIVGASVNVYLRHPELCGCAEAGCRVAAVAGRPRAALLHPIRAIVFLAAPACAY